MLFHRIMAGFLLILALCVLGALVYIARSGHFTDRLVGVNLISTLILNFIVVLALFLKNTAILDIDVVYALLSFQAVVVLSRILRLRKLADQQRRKEERR